MARTRSTKNKPSRRKNKPSRRPAPKDIAVKVDARLKALYDALVEEIELVSRQDALQWDKRWEAAGKIVDHDPPLYVLGGFANDDEFFRAVMHEEPRNARRYVRVAKFASPLEESTYGITKLDAALGLVEAKLGAPLAHPPLPVAFERLRVPTRGGSVRLEAATVADLTAATAGVRRGSGEARPTPARAALETALARVSSLSDVVVREAAGRVSFTNVPLAAFERFVGTLGRVRLPALGSASPNTKSPKSLGKTRAGRPAIDGRASGH